jgi:hypothetical protein
VLFRPLLANRQIMQMLLAARCHNKAVLLWQLLVEAMGKYHDLAVKKKLSSVELPHC